MNERHAHRQPSEDMQRAIEAAERGDGRGYAKLYLAGLSTNEIAKVAPVSSVSVWRQLKDEGIAIRPGGRPKKQPPKDEEPTPFALRKPQPPPVKHCVCAKPVRWKKHGGKWQCRKCLRLEA